MNKRIAIIVTVVLAAIIIAAGGWYITSMPDASPITNNAQPEGNALDCETERYACSFEDMDNETYQRGTQLLDNVADRVDAGESLFTVNTWLDSQENVTTTKTDGRAIVFRIDGSVPFIYEHPEVRKVAVKRSGGVVAEKTPQNTQEKNLANYS